jgi:SAM-dependent methyltransferase
LKALEWDERYRATELVWGGEPNRWVAQETADLAPGRALDLGCGEGRNAIWLAAGGWQVTAVDFSAVGLGKGRAIEAAAPGRVPVSWVLADVTRYASASPVDLALICYLQLPADERGAAVRAAAGALAPGGVLLVIGHHARNLTHGVGGPQDPAVLFTAEDVVHDLHGLNLVIDKADTVCRDVAGSSRPALDALVRAHAS